MGTFGLNPSPKNKGRGSWERGFHGIEADLLPFGIQCVSKLFCILFILFPTVECHEQNTATYVRLGIGIPCVP